MMSSKSDHPSPKPVIGYTTRRHLLLDLDNTALNKVEGLVKELMEQYPQLGDALILQTKQGTHREWLRYTRTGRVLRVRDLDNFHVVFDNSIGYNTSCYICEILARLGILNRDYVKIRKFRGDMTLRVSPIILSDRIKPMPKPVHHIINSFTTRRDGYIIEYLMFLYYVDDLFKSPIYQPSSPPYKQLESPQSPQ